MPAKRDLTKVTRNLKLLLDTLNKSQNQEDFSTLGEDTQSNSDILDQSAQDEQSDLISIFVSKMSENKKLISQAMERVKLGTFGKCIDCDGNIPIPRLEVIPYAPRCLSCQKIEDEKS
jgi:RNA polymerase-binding transcription factor DksA